MKKNNCEWLFKLMVISVMWKTTTTTVRFFVTLPNASQVTRLSYLLLIIELTNRAQ